MCRADICSAVTNYDLSSELGLTSCDYVDPDNTGKIKPGKNNLSIMQINTRGLLNKIDRLREIINHSQPDIILLCKTWLNDRTTDLIEIKGYKLISKNRTDRIGGGVAKLTKKELRSHSRDDLCVETKHLEHLVVELKTDKSNVLLVSGYRPPNTSTKTLLVEYKKLINSIRKCKSHEIVVGLDHNLDLMNLTSDLTPCITKPTRITHTTATLLDNIFVSPRLQQNLCPLILTEDISDHLPILVLLGNQKKCLKQSKKVTVRNLSEENIQKIRNDLDSVKWEEILSVYDCTKGFETFHNTVMESINKHAPEEIKRVTYKKQIRDPWITKGILVSLAKQKRLYRDQLHAKSSVSTHKYRTYRNLLKSTIRKSKNSYLHDKCLEFKQDSRKLWKLVNRIIGKNNNKTETIDSLKIDNILKYDPVSITKGFCDFFSNIGENYAKNIDQTGVDIRKLPRANNSQPSNTVLFPNNSI